jgi:hypothetical protein
MDFHTQANKILESLKWDKNFVLKKARSNSSAIIAEHFVYAIITTGSIKEAATALNCGYQTLNRVISKHLIPSLGSLNGGNETWLYKLRTLAKIKKCSGCKEVLNYCWFSTDNSNSDSKHSHCNTCRKITNKNWYSDNKDYHREYLAINRESFNFNNAKRRAAKIKAIPSWASLEEIAKLYSQRKVDEHVDHIYPLQSSWVCGLHVKENLQILSADENLSKSNKYDAKYHD